MSLADLIAAAIITGLYVAMVFLSRMLIRAATSYFSPRL